MLMLLLSSLFLAGCNTWQGSWLLTVHLEELSSDTEGTTEYGNEQVLAVCYALADGSAAADIAGLEILVGAVDGESFAFEYSETSNYSSDSCGQESHTTKYTFDGDITADGGLTGSITGTSSTELDDCGRDEPEDSSYRYDVVGVHMNADDHEHPEASISWGYFPGYL